MPSSLETWKALTQPPAVVEFFRGLFERVGLRITDTGEQFTATHHGDRVEFTPSLDPAAVNYVVEITTEHVERLAGHVRTGSLDEDEQYRILIGLFTPATAAMLKHKVFANPWLRMLSGVEDLMHVRLLPTPPTAPGMQHTLIYSNRQWVVLPGLHGTPKRTFTLALADALTYHRRVFATLKANKLGEWLKFSGWYKEWRKGVSVVGTGGVLM